MPTGLVDGTGAVLHVTNGVIEDGIWSNPVQVADTPGESDKWATLYGAPCRVGSWCEGGVSTYTAVGTYIDHEWAVEAD